MANELDEQWILSEVYRLHGAKCAQEYVKRVVEKGLKGKEAGRELENIVKEYKRFDWKIVFVGVLWVGLVGSILYLLPYQLREHPKSAEALLIILSFAIVMPFCCFLFLRWFKKLFDLADEADSDQAAVKLIDAETKMTSRKLLYLGLGAILLVVVTRPFVDRAPVLFMSIFMMVVAMFCLGLGLVYTAEQVFQKFTHPR